MRSTALLRGLEKIPASDTPASLRDTLVALDGKCVDLEVAENVGNGIETFLLDHYVTDDLKEAFEAAYPQLATEESLQEAAARLAEEGAPNLTGLISGLKGKLAELASLEILEDRFGYSFELAGDPTQPIWDLIGHGPDGNEVLVQVKMRGADAAADVASMMADHPDVSFAVGSELHAALVASHPELVEQLIDIGVENLELSDNVEDALETLAEAEGIGVPDDLLEWAPYFGEIALGIKLIISVVTTEKKFTHIEADQRRKLHAVRALVLFSRFGVSTVMSTVGGAAGTAIFPVGGTLAGILAGIVGSIALNRTLRPHIVELGLGLTGLDRDDLFYYDNADRIEALGERLMATPRILLA